MELLSRSGLFSSGALARALQSPFGLVVSVLLLCASSAVQSARYVANLPQCQTPELLALLEIDHQNGDLATLESELALLEQCTLPPKEQRLESRLPNPLQGVINFESPHVHPLDLTPNNQRLLAVNTVANSLEVFDLSGGQLRWLDSIPVGHDPVTVRVRNDSEAWVINAISDSISIVDLQLGAVVRTLQTDNEPADVVFAESHARAFVSSGDKNRVLVYSLSDLNTVPQSLPLAMEEPRALAISPDGSTVYAASFESGNATTTISGRPAVNAAGGSEDVISRIDSPYGGQNPVPNDGANFSPALTAGGLGGISSLIVRKNSAGHWMDDNLHDWTEFVSGAKAEFSGRVQGWDLRDYDLAHIDTQNLSVSYTSGLMNINAAVAVSPLDGRVLVVGTDASNQKRFQANLNGTFLRVNYAGVGATQALEIGDLNPHLDYSVGTLPPEQRAQSIGDPRAVIWQSDGSGFYVSGMGSNNIIWTARDGSRLGTLEVGEGPTGLVLDSEGDFGYVLNRFDGSVSRFDAGAWTLEETVAFYDPTPERIKKGRPHLYNTHEGSGLGQLSCASCHVDARTDRLAWDLGEPNGAFNFSAHPMKGAMQTQSLVDIIRFPNFHWRGDRLEILDFNPTFTQLQGATSQLNGAEVAELEGYLGTIHFPPSPYRLLDNTLSTQVDLPAGAPAAVGNAQVGRVLLNACLGCHGNGLSRSNEGVELFGQTFIPPAFHGFYKRLGFVADSASGSLSGFGMFHDGADSLSAATQSADLLAALLSFDGPDNDLAPVQSRQDTHAAVGKQVTFTDMGSQSQQGMLAQMLSLAASQHLELIAKRGAKVGRRGYLYDGAHRWLSDREGEVVDHAQLLASVDASHPITFTLVVEGTGMRLGLDRDLDGALDGGVGSNYAPVFGFTGIRASKIGEFERFQLPATDRDGDRLSFGAEQLPEGLSLDSSSGVISGVPTVLGESTVLVTVSDGQNGDSLQITWRVLNELPVQPPIKIGANSIVEFLFLLISLIFLRSKIGFTQIRHAVDTSS